MPFHGPLLLVPVSSCSLKKAEVQQAKLAHHCLSQRMCRETRLEARPFTASWGREELRSEGSGVGSRPPHPHIHTSADQPCILSVVTVAPAPGASGTVPEGLLSSSTPHVVHPHRSLTRSESGTPRGGQRSPTS